MSIKKFRNKWTAGISGWKNNPFEKYAFSSPIHSGSSDRADATSFNFPDIAAAGKKKGRPSDRPLSYPRSELIDRERWKEVGGGEPVRGWVEKRRLEPKGNEDNCRRMPGKLLFSLPVRLCSRKVKPPWRSRDEAPLGKPITQ